MASGDEEGYVVIWDLHTDVFDAISKLPIRLSFYFFHVCKVRK
jgi:hypothetical protein